MKAVGRSDMREKVENLQRAKFNLKELDKERRKRDLMEKANREAE